MEDVDVARELGKLSEAVGNLKEAIERIGERGSEKHDALEKRLGKLENRHSWAHGALVTVGTAVGFLGLDRLAAVFIHR